MSIKSLVLTALATSLLLACSPAEKAADKPADKPATERSQQIIPAYQLEALEKAKGVEQMTKDAAAAQRKALEEAGG